MRPTKILIDGIDRVGKSSLIKRLKNEYGYHLVIHFDKPEVLESHLKLVRKIHNAQTGAFYGNDFGSTVQTLPTKEAALYVYQVETNKFMFQLMNSDVPIIFDRTHLGEMVYAPLYRKYSGEYIYEIEKESIQNQDDIKMILLTTSNFDMLEDDGLSFDFSKKEDEQKMFIEAFNKSNIKNKVIVDVHNGKGGYKTYEEVFKEAMK